MISLLRRSSIVYVGIVSLLAGSAVSCGGSAANNGSSNTSNATDAKIKGASTDKPKTDATAQGTANATGQTSPVTKPKVSSLFHLVADVDYELDLYRLGKNAVFMGGGHILPIRDNTVAFDAKYALTSEIRGDGVMGAFQTLLGAFPESFYASVVRASGRTGLTELYKWSGSKWTSEYATRESMSVLDVRPWLNGTMLAVEFDSMFGDFNFTVLPKGSKVFVPEPNDLKPAKTRGFCASGFIAEGLTTTTSGHAFVSGTTCSNDNSPEDGRAAIKHYSSANPKGVLEVLPDIGKNGLAGAAVIARSEKDAYVAGDLITVQGGRTTNESPYLAHYDGTSWKTSTLPFSDVIANFDYDAQGKLWVISKKGAVYSRVEGGAWTEVSLPSAPADVPILPLAMWVRAPGDEWILGKAGNHSVVLHSGSPGPMAQLPDLETMEDKVTELAMPTPFTPRCMTPFVLLYTLSKVAPPDFDYPATKEALKGHTEFEGAQFIEFKRLDKRFMGAFVPDAEMGKKLVELVKKKVPNSTPQLACHAPKPSRAIEIDLSR